MIGFGLVYISTVFLFIWRTLPLPPVATEKGAGKLADLQLQRVLGQCELMPAK